MCFLGSSAVNKFNSGYKNLHKHLDHFTFQMGLTQINNPLDPSGLFAYLSDEAEVMTWSQTSSTVSMGVTW